MAEDLFEARQTRQSFCGAIEMDVRRWGEVVRVFRVHEILTKLAITLSVSMLRQ
jgi:hypothetical protein